MFVFGPIFQGIFVGSIDGMNGHHNYLPKVNYVNIWLPCDIFPLRKVWKGFQGLSKTFLKILGWREFPSSWHFTSQAKSGVAIVHIDHRIPLLTRFVIKRQKEVDFSRFFLSWKEKLVVGVKEAQWVLVSSQTLDVLPPDTSS